MVPEIIGVDGGLAGVMSLVRLAARTRVNILIHGETGSGKEVIAQEIHRRSSGAGGPFVVANCAAIPRELMESEMFGHVRGAYTGAFREHGGYFAAARGGTLLLDEIGDLHPDLQAKILHVVETGAYRKVGSTRSEHHSARLMAATHRRLPQLVREGRFRADLFYRLDILEIPIPPLRERTRDIAPLARHFLRESCERHGREAPKLGRGALVALEGYDWPGNVRELRTCMERVALLTEAQMIQAEDICHTLTADRGNDATRPVQPLAVLEREAIEHALRQFGQNRTRAARALGISRRTLQVKLKRYAEQGRV